ncbi:MAG: energy-coupling factor ABC transporter ATP-binding protein [Propionibacteriaceae bacterium]|jgi:biotin transport system ATP-binding protein|nr:energy-coupling factor ABC transporter ATP-binding protein [Propionibacteriaceae bacterium]
MTHLPTTTPDATAQPSAIPIIIDHVGHIFDVGTPRAHQVLTDITLKLDERRVGIIGHNGSGKSTLIRMLDGLIQPTSGHISVAGHDTVRDAKIVRRHTGFIFTEPDHQIIMPTVREDVAFSLRRSGLDKATIATKVDAMLVRFGLTDSAEKPAHLLSGGQKQLLALAAVLINAPTLLLADEPTTLLDIRNAQMFSDLICELPQTIIMSTHQLALLRDFERVVVFHCGQVVADGSPAEAKAHYLHLMETTSE